MRKNIFNLMLILLMLNSLYNILNQFTLPSLCPFKGPFTKDKCRFYNLSSDKIDEYGYPKAHKDSDKYQSKIINWFIPSIIFYFLVLSVCISYLLVPQKLKKTFSLIVIALAAINGIVHIYIRATTPPMCSLTKKNNKPKCINYNLYTNFVDTWGFPIRHLDDRKFHKASEGLRIPSLILNIIVLCFTIFVFIKK